MELKIKNISDIEKLFKERGYKTKLVPLNKIQYDFPQKANALIDEFYLISDYRNFQIYFIKIVQPPDGNSSLKRSEIRNILESFYRRFPQVNTLFLFTIDFKEIILVSPLRALIDSKVKLILRYLFLDPINVYHTDLEVLDMLKINVNEQSPDIIWKKHQEAFNVERVTEKFFNAYKNAIEFIKKEVLLPQKKAELQKCHSYAQQLLSRIMFLYFIQKKGWLKWRNYIPDKKYLKNLWEYYKNWKKEEKADCFYSEWLSSLFFGSFNKKQILISTILPEEIKESFTIMPFLNGGLFTENQLDEIRFEIPDKVFELLFDIEPNDQNKGFLERYNFTIREDTPLEIEVAVDPEMLGKVYESLIAEEERGNIGIFYTPRIEIDFMCRMSLIEYLATETKIDKEKITDFIYEPQNKINNLSKDELSEIKNKLDNLKIVDPAVGSASFLVGMMNILVELHTLLTKQIEGKEENLFALKQKIIQENLYGVDVKDWAVMVAELRLWLSLIIETEEKYMDIYTKPLLPNLSFKIRQGDSLVEEIGGVQISLRGETFKYLPNRLKSKIKELIDRKNAFFSGQRSANLKEIKDIEKFEQDIFIEIIDSKIKDLTKEIENWNKRIKDLNGAKDVFNEEDLKAKLEIEERTNQIEDLKKEKEKYEELINKLKNKTQKDYFLWEVDFAEVFAQKGGFDIVIGN
ncbi:MAG: hypothetical protein N2589_07540, partial [bacterium]|nr:hypothetical protein [bacterium]